MFFTTLRRVIKFGWQGFWRNKGLSFQVIFVMMIAVLVVTSFFFLKEITSLSIEEMQKKVDISVYFKKDITEDNILEVREELRSFSEEIKDVDYVSQEQALAKFREEHEGDPLYLEALEEVESNPFLASLNIKARNPGQYAQISNFLEEGPFNELIERVSYSENKTVIDKLFAITSNIKTGGIILSVILGILVILIIFNTIKLTILASKEEIATMRLVGASNRFIRAPFLVQSILYGIFAVIVVDLLFFAVLSFLDAKLEAWLLNLSLLDYFKDNIILFVVIQLAFAGILGGFSNLLAVRKYLKV